MTRERLLTVDYSWSDDKADLCDKLCRVLDKNNIDYVCYFPMSFVIRHGGEGTTWDDIRNLVNSVKAVKFNFVASDFYLSDKVERGNIQEVVCCN